MKINEGGGGGEGRLGGGAKRRISFKEISSLFAQYVGLKKK